MFFHPVVVGIGSLRTWTWPVSRDNPSFTPDFSTTGASIGLMACAIESDMQQDLLRKQHILLASTGYVEDEQHVVFPPLNFAGIKTATLQLDCYCIAASANCGVPIRDYAAV